MFKARLTSSRIFNSTLCFTPASSLLQTPHQHNSSSYHYINTCECKHCLLETLQSPEDPQRRSGGDEYRVLYQGFGFAQLVFGLRQSFVSRPVWWGGVCCTGGGGEGVIVAGGASASGFPAEKQLSVNGCNNQRAVQRGNRKEKDTWQSEQFTVYMCSQKLGQETKKNF